MLLQRRVSESAEWRTLPPLILMNVSVVLYQHSWKLHAAPFGQTLGSLDGSRQVGFSNSLAFGMKARHRCMRAESLSANYCCLVVPRPSLWDLLRPQLPSPLPSPRSSPLESRCAGLEEPPRRWWFPRRSYTWADPRLVWGHELIQGTLEKYARDTFSRRPVVNDGKVSQLQSPIMHAVANALLVC